MELLCIQQLILCKWNHALERQAGLHNGDQLKIDLFFSFKVKMVIFQLRIDSSQWGLICGAPFEVGLLSGC